MGNEGLEPPRKRVKAGPAPTSTSPHTRENHLKEIHLLKGKSIVSTPHAHPYTSLTLNGGNLHHIHGNVFSLTQDNLAVTVKLTPTEISQWLTTLDRATAARITRTPGVCITCQEETRQIETNGECKTCYLDLPRPTTPPAPAQAIVLITIEDAA